jgi:hypothetical protein
MQKATGKTVMLSFLLGSAASLSIICSSESMRCDAMLAKLADYDAQNILAFNRQLDVSVTALKQSDTQRAFQHLLVRSH